MEILSLDLTQAVTNVARCVGVFGIHNRRLISGENCMALQCNPGARKILLLVIRESCCGDLFCTEKG